MSDTDRLAEIKARRPRIVGQAETTAYVNSDIDWLVGEVDRLRGLLARLEWVEQGYNCVDYDEICPVCQADKDTPHDPGCWLAAELKP